MINQKKKQPQELSLTWRPFSFFFFNAWTKKIERLFFFFWIAAAILSAFNRAHLTCCSGRRLKKKKHIHGAKSQKKNHSSVPAKVLKFHGKLFSFIVLEIAVHQELIREKHQDAETAFCFLLYLWITTLSFCRTPPILILPPLFWICFFVFPFCKRKKENRRGENTRGR